MTSEGVGPARIHPDLAQHTGAMVENVYTLKGYIHTAFAYAPSNCTLIEGEDGLILVDSLSTVENAERAHEAFRKITNKPIKAVIFTHCHADHVSGVEVFVSEEDVAGGV